MQRYAVGKNQQRIGKESTAYPGAHTTLLPTPPSSPHHPPFHTHNPNRHPMRPDVTSFVRRFIPHRTFHNLYKWRPKSSPKLEHLLPPNTHSHHPHTNRDPPLTLSLVSHITHSPHHPPPHTTPIPTPSPSPPTSPPLTLSPLHNLPKAGHFQYKYT